MSRNNKNKDWVSAVIIEDSDNDETTSNLIKEKKQETIIQEQEKEKEPELEPAQELEPTKQKRKRTVAPKLSIMYNNDPNIVEFGIDEVGRGPMFGRVYAGLVVLPKDDSFDHSQMKDSKKFHSKKKIDQVAQYIKDNAIAWSIQYEDEQTIDEINILQATQLAMHKCIKDVMKQLHDIEHENILLLVDGSYFKPMTLLNKTKTKLESLNYVTVTGGDNKFSSIAAASILAKVERDKYIEELCLNNPELSERYGIDSNKGYGSSQHLAGIKEYGITKWHRKTFGICKSYDV